MAARGWAGGCVIVGGERRLNSGRRHDQVMASQTPGSYLCFVDALLLLGGEVRRRRDGAKVELVMDCGIVVDDVHGS